MSKSLKKWAIAAASILVIGLSFTSSSVRATAADFLTLFRVEKFQTVSIDPQQLRNAERVFREKGISLNIDNFGKVTNNGVEAPKEVSIEEAIKLADFDLLLPKYLPYDYSSTLQSFAKAGSVDLQLDVANVNNLIRSLGGSTMLPDTLNNKTFTLRTPNSFFLRYKVLDGDGKLAHRLNISQFRSPEIIAPVDVDANQVREAVLSLPVIPEDVRKQLASIEDWQKTMVVPTVSGQTKEIKVGDATALFTVPEMQGGATYGILAWEKDGVIRIIEGDLSQEEMVKVAESLK